ncbi:uncharacterized protein MICPUCDRAFT_60035 [Micromonas pusilla CCMP1545]|uniref:Predicted protein n=1 Tax=Micromonas pusilla (strain CCMP1545) TaxID=564608 RepID=C1MX56_MICPC|nr:uncharacterized protein MICPUCDRAFT_60035 [Micromonas pusilla CCMP1545]EEH55106.1 predicted protein [Micromonas pusilla CCMP1545]|eukprot:XP_003060337.1 predicted protein [Micromonas pusilla CCMP1545]
MSSAERSAQVGKTVKVSRRRVFAYSSTVCPYVYCSPTNSQPRTRSDDPTPKVVRAVGSHQNEGRSPRAFAAAAMSWFYRMMQREPVVMWSCFIGGVGARSRSLPAARRARDPSLRPLIPRSTVPALTIPRPRSSPSREHHRVGDPTDRAAD